VIGVRGLSHRLPRTGEAVFQDAAFDVTAGEIYCVFAAGGRGKTTLVRVLLGELAPSSGHVLINGVDVSGNPGITRADTTFVLAERALYPEMTMKVNVRFFASIARATSAHDGEAVDNALRRAGVPEALFNQRAGNVSRGAATLAWLAVTILRDSPVIVLDDPTQGLTTDDVVEIRSTLKDLRRQGKAILIMTSDLAFATVIADRIGVLQRGGALIGHTSAELCHQNVSELYLHHDDGSLSGPSAALPGRP
jgi:ABC-2 type transport system ATP-binding protein